jgi:hypothetical protein
MDRLTATARLAAAGSADGPQSADRAAVEAIGGLAGPPSLVLAFPSGLHPTVAARSLSTVCGGAPLAGITGSGAIGARGPIERGCAAIAFDSSIRVAIGVARNATRDLSGAARIATAEALGGVEGAPGHPLLILLLDTRTGDQAEAVAGAHEVAGPAIPIAGGAAGGDEPAQLIGAEATREAVLAIALVAPEPIGIGWAHGCQARAAPSIVTRSEGRMVQELDGRPAVEVYLEKLGYGDLDLSDEEFDAVAVTHPLAQAELRESSHVRHVLGRRGDSLFTATHIPTKAAVEFTHETPEAIVDASRVAVGNALNELGGAPPRAALLFDCAGRKRAVAGSLSHEVSALLDAFPSPPPPLAGLFTHGEIARTRGSKGDLNHAVVAVAFG